MIVFHPISTNYHLFRSFSELKLKIFEFGIKYLSKELKTLLKKKKRNKKYAIKFENFSFSEYSES